MDDDENVTLIDFPQVRSICKFNLLNLLVDDDENVTLIDFPQVRSITNIGMQLLAILGRLPCKEGPDDFPADDLGDSQL